MKVFRESDDELVLDNRNDDAWVKAYIGAGRVTMGTFLSPELTADDAERLGRKLIDFARQIRAKKTRRKAVKP